MAFQPKRCSIPAVYCGKGAIPARTNEVRYTRRGTPTECMSRGFGAGMASERLKSLPEGSLQRIKYVGEAMEAKFRASGIRTLNGLIIKMKGKTPEYIDTTLKRILRKSNNALDSRAYNSVLLFLYMAGIPNIPQCAIIRA